MVEDGLPGEAAVITNAAVTTVRLVRREPCSTGQLWGWMARLSVVLVIWFVGWPLRVSLLQSSAAEVWS